MECDGAEVAAGVPTGVIALDDGATPGLSDPVNAPTSSFDGAGPASAGANPYHKVSAPLVEAVTAGITANSFGKSQNRFVRQTFSLLLSIPIWLMIVLLSPFDAYLAAKHISGQGALK